MKYWVTVVAIFLLLNNVNSKDVRHTSKCSHALTNQKGTFSTPQLLSQPGYYPDNTHCKWNITVPRDGNVTITFTNFDTEACCDHVIITNERGKLIGQYSGPKSTFDITLTYDQAHRVDIVFKSDESVYKAGFHAHYVIHGQSKPAPLVKPTTAVPLVQPVGGGDSLMEAFLKMSSGLTRIINSLLYPSAFANSKQVQSLKSEIYQALQNLGTLNSVKTSALTKDENEQINVALKYLNLRAKAAITKLRPKLSPAVCKLPKVAGPCRAAFKRFYYNGRRCALFYYGGCQGNANNFGSKKSCEKLCEYQMCPDGIPVFNCFVNPCHERSCSAYMITDRCEDNYCGGCNAVYYDQHNLVIPNDRCHCPLNETTVDCAIDPCQHASCPSYPDAKCRSRRCNKCTAEFVFANSTIVENC